MLMVSAGVIALCFIFFAWGVARIRRNESAALRAIADADPSAAESLQKEAIQILKEKMKIDISLDDPEAAASKISQVFDRTVDLKLAFARDGFEWYFVLPMGALLGEYLRRHARGCWVKLPAGDTILRDGGPAMELTSARGGTPVLTYPFHKALKQIVSGDPKDIYAYLKTAEQLEELKPDQK